MYVYNISGGVANICYQSCAQIDNNQQVYEAQIQVPRCNSILKVVSHECQNLSPLHLDRCTMSTQTTVPRQLMVMSVCCLPFGPDLAFGNSVSNPHQIFPHPLFLSTLYFIIIITIFTFILSKVAYNRYRPNYLFRFHIGIKNGITIPLLFFLISFQVGNKS